LIHTPNKRCSHTSTRSCVRRNAPLCSLRIGCVPSTTPISSSS
jgi:hypothetical protein